MIHKVHDQMGRIFLFSFAYRHYFFSFGVCPLRRGEVWHETYEPGRDTCPTLDQNRNSKRPESKRKVRNGGTKRVEAHIELTLAVTSNVIVVGQQQMIRFHYAGLSC